MRKNSANKFLLKPTAVLAVICVFLLNFTSVIPCGQTLINDECCHQQNIVKPCCVKNMKFITTERLESHCGCSLSQVISVDLYTDLQQLQNRTGTFLIADIESVTVSGTMPDKNVSYAYSPSQYFKDGLYLVNQNLRI